MGVLAELAADKLRAGKHVRPLVVAAELEVAAVIQEQSVEVITLHEHVIELKECQTLLHSLLIALSRKHTVDREMCADLPKEIHIIQVKQPVSVIDHECFSVGEVDKTAHLDLEAIDIVLNCLFCEDLSQILTTGRIADHSCSASKKRDRLIAGHLKSLHKAQRHEMTYMKAVCRRVKADIESCLSVIQHIPYLIFVCDLRKQASCFQFFVNLHHSIS